MKSLILFSSIFVIGVFALPREETLANCTGGADSANTCIVTGDPASESGLGLRYIDKNIQFCNEGCEMAFKKEPAKYLKNGLRCAPCGEDDAKKNISHTHNGVKYYFCGNGCKTKFESDAQKYLDKYKEN